MKKCIYAPQGIDIETKYIQNLLKRFKEDCNGCSTPIEKDFKIDLCDDQNQNLLENWWIA